MANTTPKRGRGRPRKIKPENTNSSFPLLAEKNPRGRPPKSKAAGIAVPAVIESKKIITDVTMNATNAQEMTAPIKRKTKLFSGSQIMQEMERVAKVSWIIDDFFPQSANVCMMYGAPSSYKSFIALDMMLSIAHGRNYHGRDAEQGSVVYIAAEGGAGLWKRIVAWHKFHGLTEITDNFIVRDGGINLHDKKELAALTAELMEANIKPKFIVIDTLARCFGDLDENSNAAMGSAVNSCDILRELIGSKVLIIHHSGKDKTKGSRGGNALPGGVDTSFEITAVGQKVCKLLVKKQKDEDDGKEFFYKMNIMPLDFQDLKGNQITSLVPELDNKLGAANKPLQQLSGTKAKVFDALKAAIEAAGEDGVTLEQWQGAYYDMEKKVTPDNKRVYHNREYKVLLKDGLIYECNGLFFAEAPKQ